MDKKKSCAQRTQNKLKIDKIVRMYSSNFNISFHYSSFVSLFHCNYIHLIHFLIMYESKKMHPFYNFPSSSTIFLFQLLHDPTRFSCGSEANTVRLLIEDGKCTIFTIWTYSLYIYISRYKYFKPARNAMLCSFCHHIKFSYFNFLALQKSHYCSFHFKEHTEYSDTRYIISISELKVNVISGAIYGCTEMEWIVVVRVSLHWEKYLPIKLGTHFIEFASAYDFELLTRFQN